MLQLNAIALAALTRLALPAMASRRRGHIPNVGSLVGYQPAGPRMAAYYGSKAFVESFSRGLAAELKGSGVAVTTLSPGPTGSFFEERSGAARSNIYRYFPRADPGSVARAGIDGMKKGSGERRTRRPHEAPRVRGPPVAAIDWCRRQSHPSQGGCAMNTEVMHA